MHIQLHTCCFQRVKGGAHNLGSLLIRICHVQSMQLDTFNKHSQATFWKTIAHMGSQSVGRKGVIYSTYCSPSWAPFLGSEALLSSDPKRAWLGRSLVAALSPTWRTKGVLRHRNRCLWHGCVSPECPKGEQLLMLEQGVPCRPSAAVQHLPPGLV